MMELEHGGGHECACKQKNRLTCITLKNTDGISSSQKTATAEINELSTTSPLTITNLSTGNYGLLPTGTVFTVQGIAGSYTLTAPLIAGSTSMQFSPSLASLPTVGLAITFTLQDGGVSRLVGAVHTEGSYYEFDIGTSFSVHRYKPCTIRVCSGSVGYRNDVPEYLQAASARVNEIGASGGTLTVDTLYIPQHVLKAGSTFTVEGITGTTFTLSAAFTSPDGTTLTFTPNLPSSPADNALVTFAPTTVGVASIDLMTNIEVQGLCKNMPNSPAGQVVQCEMDVSATNQLNVTANNLTGIRIFHAAQPYMTQFRCQSLPDRIQLQMARVSALFDQTANNFSLSAPDFISITLEIEFDE
jgi:hypothetical protein